MVDNYDEIVNFLHFEDKNSFYFLSTIKRKKDNPDMKKQEYVVDQYYLYSRKEFEKMRERIIESCHLHNARLYLRINMRDSMRIAYKLVLRIGELMDTNNFSAIANAYDSMVGKFHHDPIKKFMIDVDNIEDLVEIKEIVARANGKILLELTTKNGVHLVTNGFDVREINKKFPKILSKNGSVLMYCP